MPVLIPLAINIGFYIDYLIRRFNTLTDKRETFPVYVHFGLIACIGLAFPILGYVFLKDAITSHLVSYILASIVLFGLGLSMLAYLRQKNIRMVFRLTILFFAGVILTVLPLSKGVTNEQYQSISNLKTELEAEGLKLYAENYVSPEMLWYYGDKIPFISLHDEESKMPNESRFGLLSKDPLKEKTLNRLETDFEIKKLRTYNLNRFPSDSKPYNDRLLNVFYIFERK